MKKYTKKELQEWLDIIKVSLEIAVLITVLVTFIMKFL